jgi:glycine betaine/proline transport system ATP-binding protein
LNLQVRTETAPKAAAKIKISCRELWKVYGPNVGFYFDTKGYRIDPEHLAERLREERHIPAVANVSLEISEGEIFVIMGLSGSGKSTVLRCLSRLIEPTYGQVNLDGCDLTKLSERDLIDIRRHKMGMVFQQFGLLPHLNAIDNVAFPLKVQGIAKRQRQDRAQEVIELVGLKGREQAYPRQLSGGQQQRVGIARSLAVGPEVWFLDEPFSALDPLIRRQLQDTFLQLQKQLGKTIVFVTHDFTEALRIADRICVMKDGVVVQVGTAEDLVLNPANQYVRGFVSDAPLAKVLRVSAVMKPGIHPVSCNDRRPAVAQSAKIENAMKLFEVGVDAVNVVNEAGEIVGELTPSQVICALARDPEGSNA